MSAAGQGAGELVHSQVEELVEAELCLHAAAPGVFTRPGDVFEPRRAGHGLHREKKRELERLNVKTHATLSCHVS